MRRAVDNLRFQNTTGKSVIVPLAISGREDIFPKLWTSRAGKKGYSPACSNDWIFGTCGKTRKPPVIKCSECRDRKFLPVTDQVIIEHLQGRHVIGVYPMFPDDTCCFLAADFDKSTWMDDVRAFRETCKSVNIPVAIERSRSGNGAHAWFFFTEPVSAATARTMGCYLITETMSRRHQLSMESYDRLFPSQDTLTKGGFGNLIALPFQQEPRQKGNTVFLDENFTPYADQWAYLASIGRLLPDVIQRIANEAIRQGAVLGCHEIPPKTGTIILPGTGRHQGKYRRRKSAGNFHLKRAVFCSASLYREEGPAIAFFDPHQEVGSVSKSDVLREAELASLDGPDTSCNFLL